MAEMYFNLVLAHKRTCNEENKSVTLVPITYRADVLAMLTARGYDADGNVKADNY